MKELCIIAKNKETYFIKRLTEEVRELTLFDPWSDFILPEASLYLVRTTGVYKSDLDLLMLKGLDPVVNSYKSLVTFRSKKTQYLWLEENNFSCLPFVSLKDTDPLVPEKFTVLYPEVVVKPDVGQGGWGIEVLKRDTLKSWMKKHDQNYLLQPYIKGARELRYFFLKGHDPIVLERKAKSGMSANFKQGGEAKLSKIPDEFGPELQRLVDLSGAHYGAIDLFIHDGRLLILELNTVPGIEQLEVVSGLNVAKNLVRSFSL